MELKEKKVIAQKKRDKPFVRMRDDIWEASKKGAREYVYCMMRNAGRICLFDPD